MLASHLAPHRLALSFLLTLLAGFALTGPAPAQETTIPVAGCQQSQVHVFIIHGLDPFDYANLRGLRDHCHKQGYMQTTYAQFYHGPWIIDRVRQIKANDPGAKVLVFGFSAGTLTARSVVNTLHSKHGIDVDVVVYTSGITMLDREYNHPSFVGKVIHIRDRSLLTGGVEFSRGENYKYRDAWHFGTPTHENTLAVLDRELNRLAADTPIVLPPGVPHMAAKTDGAATVSKSTSWDVVKPADMLMPPPRFITK